MPEFVDQILAELERAGVPPAEVQQRLRHGEDLRLLIREAGLSNQIGMALLISVTQLILGRSHGAN